MKSLKSTIHDLVNQMVEQSPDFKTYMNTFEQLVKLEEVNQSFEDIFLKEILKDPVVIKVLGKNIKRQKPEQVFIYGSSRKKNQILASGINSNSGDNNKKSQVLNQQDNMANYELESVYQEGLTVQSYNNWKSALNPNSVNNSSKKMVFDPVTCIVQSRYGLSSAKGFSNPKLKYLGPVTNSISKQATTVANKSNLANSQKNTRNFVSKSVKNISVAPSVVKGVIKEPGIKLKHISNALSINQNKSKKVTINTQQS